MFSYQASLHSQYFPEHHFGAKSADTQRDTAKENKQQEDGNNELIVPPLMLNKLAVHTNTSAH